LRSAQLRDSIITAVSDYTWSELEGAEGKTRLRDELISRVNAVVAPAAIGRLYFTQFVIQ
jgi:flagellar basal body-associated protein FliL